MLKLDARAARILFGVLGLVALISFANSLAAALRAPRAEVVSAGVDPSRDPVPNASAVVGGQVLDEARIRQIAREEASAALGARKSAPAAAKPRPEPDAASDDDSPAKPVLVTPPSAPPVLTSEPPAPRVTPG